MFDQARLRRLSDYLAVGVAVTLPWSTSATSILIPLWMIVLLPTLGIGNLRKTIFQLPALLPLVLWSVALAGIVWAEAPINERIRALESFQKFLVVPLVITYFKNSDKGPQVLFGFLLSCSLVLMASWTTGIFRSLWLTGFVGPMPGVPAKDYAVQSCEFLLCAFALGHLAFDAWQERQRRRALLFVSWSIAFIANIVFIATARSTLITLVVLLAAFSLQRLSLKGAIAFFLGSALIAFFAWNTSSYLQRRVTGAFAEVQRYLADNSPTSSGLRLEYAKKSIEIIAAAPLAGHGTGSVSEMFRRLAAANNSSPPGNTRDPHNQTLMIAIQLGAIGVTLLFGMWIVHTILFARYELWACIGISVVLQNVVASLFFSSLSNFTTGWIYVLGISVLGGMVLRDQASTSARLSKGGESRHQGHAGLASRKTEVPK